MSNLRGMSVVENPDGTLWIDIDEAPAVDAIRRRLSELGVPVTALVPDPNCRVTVEEVEWSDLYPKIVPRNGPEPGIIVQPSEIPPDHTLLLAAHTMSGAPHRRGVVTVLTLIRGPAPSCIGKIITSVRPVADEPRLGRGSGPRLMLRIQQPDEQTQEQLWVLNERLPDPLTVESSSWTFWVSYPEGFSDREVRAQVQTAIDEAGLHLIGVP
jgi:hypothetical protein